MSGDVKRLFVECLQTVGHEGMRTDEIARRIGASQRTCENYIAEHRRAGGAAYMLRDGANFGRVFSNMAWLEAAKEAQKQTAKDNRKASKRVSDAARQAVLKAARKLDAKKLQVANAEAKAKPAPVWRVECTGPTPPAHVLPSSPVYSRHQIASLPAGFTSMLNPAECRPWAMAARP